MRLTIVSDQKDTLSFKWQSSTGHSHFSGTRETALVHANDMISHLTVLNRVKDFLPRMKEAEQQLEKELNEKSPCELDIEYVDDSSPYIEMVSMKISLL